MRDRRKALEKYINKSIVKDSDFDNHKKRKGIEIKNISAEYLFVLAPNHAISSKPFHISS
jgi:hypothetical protein